MNKGQSLPKTYPYSHPWDGDDSDAPPGYYDRGSSDDDSAGSGAAAAAAPPAAPQDSQPKEDAVVKFALDARSGDGPGGVECFSLYPRRFVHGVLAHVSLLLPTHPCRSSGARSWPRPRAAPAPPPGARPRRAGAPRRPVFD